MATRKGWGDLSPAYRARLERAGIGPQVYASGASIQSARGHGYTPEHGPTLRPKSRFWANQARRRDITEFIPLFAAYPLEEQNRIGEAYVLGHWQKWRGPKIRRRNLKGELQIYKSQSDRQIEAAMDFNQAYEEANQSVMGGAFWKDFRDTYMTSLTAA